VSSLESTAAARGAIVRFSPKYHCELNPIELVWATVKRKLRATRHYTLDGLRSYLRVYLAEVCNGPSVSLFFGRVRGIEEGYRRGLSLPKIMAELAPTAHGVKRVVADHRRVSVAGMIGMIIFFFFTADKRIFELQAKVGRLSWPKVTEVNWHLLLGLDFSGKLSGLCTLRFGRFVLVLTFFFAQ
jgi:hypothetical protein